MAQAEMAIMGREGDTKLTWDSREIDEVKTARRMFKDLRAKGYAAFSVKGKHKRGEQIDTFDPDAEQIIMVPPMVGG